LNIAIIGAPGSGKTSLARELSSLLSLQHIEGDKLFWAEGNFTEKVADLTRGISWVYEGHIGKVAPIVLPRTQVIIHLRQDSQQSLIDVLRRDLLLGKFEKFFFNLRHHKTLELKREELLRMYPEKVTVFESSFGSYREQIKKLGKSS
jgi:ABC-type dipeptide/oligopeptide/nickel transport system ATPase component